MFSTLHFSFTVVSWNRWATVLFVSIIDITELWLLLLAFYAHCFRVNKCILIKCSNLTAAPLYLWHWYIIVRHPHEYIGSILFVFGKNLLLGLNFILMVMFQNFPVIFILGLSFCVGYKTNQQLYMYFEQIFHRGRFSLIIMVVLGYELE